MDKFGVFPSCNEEGKRLLQAQTLSIVGREMQSGHPPWAQQIPLAYALAVWPVVPRHLALMDLAWNFKHQATAL